MCYNRSGHITESTFDQIDFKMGLQNSYIQFNQMLVLMGLFHTKWDNIIFTFISNISVVKIYNS